MNDVKEKRLAPQSPREISSKDCKTKAVLCTMHSALPRHDECFKNVFGVSQGVTLVFVCDCEGKFQIFLCIFDCQICGFHCELSNNSVDDDLLFLEKKHTPPVRPTYLNFMEICQ